MYEEDPGDEVGPMLALPTELRGQVEYAIFRIPLWPGIFFKPARCGYTLRVTWPEIADMDSEHVRTLTNKMADLLYINH